MRSKNRVSAGNGSDSPGARTHGGNKAIAKSSDGLKSTKTGPIITDETDINFDVFVRRMDGYLESFDAVQLRISPYFLWMRLRNGENRTIPMCQIWTFSTNPEIHEMLWKEKLRDNSKRKGGFMMFPIRDSRVSRSQSIGQFRYGGI